MEAAGGRGAEGGRGPGAESSGAGAVGAGEARVAEPENSFVFTKVQQVPAFCHALVPASTWFYVVSGIYTCYVCKEKGSWGATAMKWSLFFSVSFMREGNDCSLVNCAENFPHFSLFIMFISKGCLHVKEFCSYVQ